MIFIYAVLLYILIVWGLIPVIVPHFRKQKLPESLPQNLEHVLGHLNAESKDNLDFLRRAFQYITSTYKGDRLKTITNFWVAFEEPINHKPGFMPCTGQNYLLRLLLVKSVRFSDADICLRIAPLNFFVHQYMQVKVDDRWIDVDPWASFLGVPLGKKCTLIDFHTALSNVG